MTNSYLSKVDIRKLLTVNGRRSRLDNAIDQHRSIMSLFPDGLGESPRSAGKILFRLDQSLNESFVIVRSSITPIESLGIRTIEEDFSHFNNGSIVRFRTNLSPIKRNGIKESFYTGEALEEWFIKKVSQFFDEVNILNIDEKSLYRNSSRSNKDFVKMAQFDGFATVKDSSSLQNALIEGIGRNKNYGCGLLTIVKASV